MVVIPNIGDIIDNVIPRPTPSAPGENAVDIIDTCYNFVVTAFNSILGVSQTIIEFITAEQQLTDEYSFSILEMMLGIGLPAFIGYVLIKWVIDILP